MFKRLTVILVLLMFIFSVMPVSAANYNQINAQNCSQINVQNHNYINVQKPIIYKSVINVTKNGGVYQVGFATIIFPKDFIDDDQLPVTINVEISAIDGVAGIEFTPDIPVFNKDVRINVHSYNGLLYEKTLGKNIKVRIKHQMLIVNHFSRYAFS